MMSRGALYTPAVVVTVTVAPGWMLSTFSPSRRVPPCRRKTSWVGRATGGGYGDRARGPPSHPKPSHVVPEHSLPSAAPTCTARSARSAKSTPAVLSSTATCPACSRKPGKRRDSAAASRTSSTPRLFLQASSSGSSGGPSSTSPVCLHPTSHVSSPCSPSLQGPQLALPLGETEARRQQRCLGCATPWCWGTTQWDARDKGRVRCMGTLPPNIARATNPDPDTRGSFRCSFP